MNMVGGYPPHSFHPAEMYPSSYAHAPHPSRYPYRTASPPPLTHDSPTGHLHGGYSLGDTRPLSHEPQPHPYHTPHPYHHDGGPIQQTPEPYSCEYMIAHPWMLNAPHHDLPGLTPDSYLHSQGDWYLGDSAPGCMRVGVRVVKRRTTANKKERRRTLSINSAFTNLRDCIPNVPADTKLSKIKTLRLACSYISYLMDLIETEAIDEGAPDDLYQRGFKVELGKRTEAEKERRRKELEEETRQARSPRSTGEHSPVRSSDEERSEKKGKGRTGWPQHVWAAELKQEPHQLKHEPQ